MNGAQFEPDRRTLRVSALALLALSVAWVPVARAAAGAATWQAVLAASTLCAAQLGLVAVLLPLAVAAFVSRVREAHRLPATRPGSVGVALRIVRLLFLVAAVLSLWPWYFFVRHPERLELMDIASSVETGARAAPSLLGSARWVLVANTGLLCLVTVLRGRRRQEAGR
jgi:hypothetical protein